ncbi:MAG: glycosyltransferase family 10 [Chitinophagaceae bacterium]
MERKRVIRIVTDNIHYNDMLRQLPQKNEACSFHFTVEDISNCDGVIVIDYPKKNILVNCIPQNVWLWNMEPPDEEWEWLRKGYKHYEKIITVDHAVKHAKIIHNQLAIPWQVNKTIDELKTNNFFDVKTKVLSFITSNYNARRGHIKRLTFLKKISGKVEFDLWGRGFKNMEDKSDGLLPYKYTIVVENSMHLDYWSEKLADAFLCGCLPFYYGCPNAETYFNKDAFIRIDIKNPQEAIRIINRAIKNGEWEKRKNLIEEARNLVINNYEFFSTFDRLFKKFGRYDGDKKEIRIPYLSHHVSKTNPFSLRRIYYLIRKTFFKNRYLNLENPLFGHTTYK